MNVALEKGEMVSASGVSRDAFGGSRKFMADRN
jgi:hypothetical protein